MVQDLIDTYEELKKYIFFIERSDKKTIIIKFKNENFYHLVGFHKLNLDIYFPKHTLSKEKKYKYIKSNIEKFDKIIENHIKEKNSIELRIKTFHNIMNLLKETQNTTLYNLKENVPGSMFAGNYGLLKIFKDIYCLLGLRIDNETEKNINCFPISWMASKQVNKLIEFKKPIYMENISVIPIEMIQESLTEQLSCV